MSDRREMAKIMGLSLKTAMGSSLLMEQRNSSTTPTRGAGASMRSSSNTSLSGASPEDHREQLEAIMDRHAQQELEQKAAAEANAWTVKQNRQTLLLLKQENKELREKMSKRGAPPTALEATKTSADKAVDKLEREVHDLRRQHDKTLQEKKTAVSKLDNLQDSIREMAAGAAAAGAAGPMGPAGRQIRSLENRLDKAIMKCNEAQSIRGTYELVLDKMRRERQQLEARIKGAEHALRSTCSSELEAAMLSHREATYARDQAKAELAAAEETLARDRARREADLVERRAQAHTYQEANRALMARQYASVEPPSPTAAAGAAAAAEAAAAELEPEGVVQQLAEALGCTSGGAGEVLSRLLPMQQQRQQLEAMQAAAEASSREAAAALALSRTHLDDMRGGGRLTTQSQLDVVQAELKEAEGAVALEAASLDALQRQYAEVRGGLEHLGAMVGGLPLGAGAMPGPPPHVNDESLGDVVAQIDQRLMGAYKLIHTLPKAATLLQGLQDNPNLNFSGASAELAAAVASPTA